MPNSVAKALEQPKPQQISPFSTPTQSPSRLSISLQQPSNRSKGSKSGKFYNQIRSLFRSFPIIHPCMMMPLPLYGNKYQDGLIHGGTRLTGTLYGCRKARATLAIQENQRCLPMLILELGVPTGKLLQEMGSGLMRIALECEKQAVEKTKLIEEPLWNMFLNGRKVGYGMKKEPSDEDLNVMQLLHAVSMGAGVLPTLKKEMPDGEMTYMRAFFERVIGSKDSETFYMMNPDGNSGPELSIFFVRF
ncbi:protein MIZU-KUSSEI 1-like [Telopea speciosissima]|uniref:protein MIZU-KUSSEI 1-like n=1 Tax=Telopea speciosissima TaxID=54955 RepID=UPI001CC78F43|nr:protein MIZU-KUSSEI 1-like [Telopea speciosissima]